MHTQYGRVTLFYQDQIHKDQTSREISAGFLYYYHPPNLPPGCGEIRFRITEHPDPGLFQQGSDLLSPYGGPWRMPLPHISHYPPIKQVLMDDDLVAPSLFSMIEDARPSDRRLVSNGINLFRIDQPWTLDLSRNRKFYINSSSSVSFETMLIRDKYIQGFPYTGKNLSNIDKQNV